MREEETIKNFIEWAEANRDFDNPWFEDQCLALLARYIKEQFGRDFHY